VGDGAVGNAEQQLGFDRGSDQQQKAVEGNTTKIQ
jgi:hypothetical protein